MLPFDSGIYHSNGFSFQKKLDFPVAFQVNNFVEIISPVQNIPSQSINSKIFCPGHRETLSPIFFFFFWKNGSPNLKRVFYQV